MDRDYEIFECLADGNVMWRARGSGLRNTRLKLDELLRDTGNEHFGLHLLSRDIVFGADVAHAPPERAAKRIFQIAYTQELRIVRADLLRKLGYPVISVIGNDAAKNLLTTLRRDNLGIGLFVVGHAASAPARRDIIDWLKANYPHTKILALNSPYEGMSNADYNLLNDSPETWVPLVATAMSEDNPSASA